MRMNNQEGKMEFNQWFPKKAILQSCKCDFIFTRIYKMKSRIFSNSLNSARTILLLIN